MLNRFVFLWVFLVAIISLHADTTVAGVGFQAPSRWSAVTPTNVARAGQWLIAPNKKGEDAAEVVMFYFGKGQGGDAKSSVDRWLHAMSNAQGDHPAGEVKERVISKWNVTEVIAYGTYTSPVPMPGVPPIPKPDYGLAGVVLEGPQGNIFIRLTGPETLVKANLTSFRQFVDSAKPVN